MAGRVPAIRRGTDADGDGRDKPGHDGADVHHDGAYAYVDIVTSSYSATKACAHHRHSVAEAAVHRKGGGLPEIASC